MAGNSADDISPPPTPRIHWDSMQGDFTDNDFDTALPPPPAPPPLHVHSPTGDTDNVPTLSADAQSFVPSAPVPPAPAIYYNHCCFYYQADSTSTADTKTDKSCQADFDMETVTPFAAKVALDVGISSQKVALDVGISSQVVAESFTWHTEPAAPSDTITAFCNFTKCSADTDISATPDTGTYSDNTGFISDDIFTAEIDETAVDHDVDFSSDAFPEISPAVDFPSEVFPEISPSVDADTDKDNTDYTDYTPQDRDNETPEISEIDALARDNETPVISEIHADTATFSRSKSIQALFALLDTDSDGILNRIELLPFARAYGFQGSLAAWDIEYNKTCYYTQSDITATCFHKLVNDTSKEGTYCTDQQLYHSLRYFNRNHTTTTTGAAASHGTRAGISKDLFF